MPNSYAPAHPSLYPLPSTATAEPLRPSAPPSSNTNPASKTAPAPSTEALPETYEVMLEIPGAVLSSSVLRVPETGMLRAIQGPINTAHNPPYYAFLSVNAVNVPLLPSCPVAHTTAVPPTYVFTLPEGDLTLVLPQDTTLELVDSLHGLLQWFSKLVPLGTPVQQSPTSSQDRIARVADRGVVFVESIGAKVNASITRKLSAKVEEAERQSDGNRAVPMGGNATSKVLSGTRSVVGAGASVAAVVIDKVSDVVGTVLARNPVSKSLAAAPEGSTRRGLHDNIAAGMLAFGRVYVAADQQGKLVIQSAGDGCGQYANVKYGEEAGDTARKLGGIALDGYRIARFPQKLGATSLLKGALKSGTKKRTDGSRPGVPSTSDSEFGMSTGNFGDGAGPFESSDGYREDPRSSGEYRPKKD